jgi:hypothetical protein
MFKHFISYKGILKLLGILGVFGTLFFLAQVEENKMNSEEYNDLKNHIIQEEGFLPAAERIGNEKYYTIGFGSNNPDIKPTQVISETEAENLLDEELKKKIALARQLLPNFDSYSPELKKHVVSSVYRGSLSGSPKTLELLRQGNFTAASQEFLDNDEYRRSLKEKTGVAPRMQAVAEAMSKEKEVPMDNLKDTQRTSDNSEESIVDKILNLFSASGAEDDQPTDQMKRNAPSEQQDMPLPTPRPMMPTEQSENPMPIPEPRPIQRAEGGSVSQEKNDPPPGSTPEEVADDIPAYLSEGEYVLPANVVKYYGIANIKRMHDIALAQLQSLEDTGVIENVDENGKVEKDGDKETKALMDRLNGGPKEAKGTSISIVIPEGFNAGGGVGDSEEDGMEGFGLEGGMDQGASDQGVSDDGMEGFGLEGGISQGLDPSPPGSEPSPGTSTRNKADKELQETLDNRGLMEKLSDLAYEYTQPSSKDSMPGVLNALMGPLAAPAAVISDIAGKLADAGYDVKQEDTPGPEGGLGEDQEKGLMSPDEDSTKITTAQDQYAPEGYVYVPGVGYRRKINPESAVDLRKGGGLMSY